MHVKRATQFDDILSKHSNEMMDDLRVTLKEEKEAADADRIERKIMDAGPDGIQHSILSNAFPKMNADKISKIIRTLGQRDLIKVVDYQTTRRPGTKYIHTNYN